VIEKSILTPSTIYYINIAELYVDFCFTIFELRAKYSKKLEGFMKNFIYFILVITLAISIPSLTLADNFENIMFLHHSVGSGLINGGGVRNLIATYNTQHGTNLEFWDHGYNANGIHDQNGTYYNNYNIPYDNTDPSGFYDLFMQPLHTPPDNAFSYFMLPHQMGTRTITHEVFIFKSCYPNSDITSESMLNQYKTWYLAIRNVMDAHPEKIFIPLSPPPLVRSATTPENAARARRFAYWLASPEYTAGHPNVFVYNFWADLAEHDSTSIYYNCLRVTYGGAGGDSHPNDLGNQTCGPLFVNHVTNAIVAYRLTQGASIAVNPDTLVFTAQRNESLPITQTFTITNIGNGILNWNVTADSSWLIAPSHSSGNNNSDTITVGVNTTNLSYGVHNAHYQITSNNAANSPQIVTVTYILPQPHISVSPISLTFSAVRNGSIPTSQSFSIANPIANSGTLNWSLTHAKNWLSLTPTSGNTNSQVITVSITATDSAIGIHYDTISVIGSNADNSPQLVYVTYTITSSTPSINLNVTNLAFIATQNGSTPSPQTFQITNGAGGTLNWSVSDTKTWLSESPASGNSNSQMITVTVAAPIDSIGTYYDTISVTDSLASNSPQTIHITYSINALNNNLALGITPSVSSTYSGYSVTPITDGIIAPRGGAATTWASTESAASPHWVEFDFGHQVLTNRLIIRWAHNAVRSAFMCSRQYYIQYDSSGIFITRTTVNNSTADSVTITDFTPILTSKIRYYQPANMGSALYPTVVWLTEMEIYGSATTNDTIPPNGILDLDGGPINPPGSIRLHWTAPGDDGTIGRAAHYEVRFHEESLGPIDNNLKWSQAILAGGAPIPSPTGTIDSISIQGLPYGARYYFCVRSFDEVDNQSPLSNSISIATSDTGAPGYCDYLIGDISGDGQRIGGDVTYGVRYFKGLGAAPMDSCYIDSISAYLYVAGDVNGNCEFRGSDITRLVAYFKGAAQLTYCHFFPTNLPPLLREQHFNPTVEE
jgi:hypothetical protein